MKHIALLEVQFRLLEVKIRLNSGSSIPLLMDKCGKGGGPWLQSINFQTGNIFTTYGTFSIFTFLY